MSIRTIDAHQHFWKGAVHAGQGGYASHPALARDFGPVDLIPEIKRAGVDATILVQSIDSPEENDRLKEYAHSECVAGIVAWLPISDPASAIGELDRISPWPKVCGVRTLIGDDSLAWLSANDVIAVFKEMARRGMTWDVVAVTHVQLLAVLKLAAAVPELRIVIDHLARPPIERVGWQPWAADLQRVASCPNVALKVSIGIDVLSNWDRWRGKDLIPYVGWAAETVGPARLMLASNWPVVLMKTGYQQAWHDLLGAVESSFPDRADLQQVKGDTALNWYGRIQ